MKEKIVKIFAAPLIEPNTRESQNFLKDQFKPKMHQQWWKVQFVKSGIIAFRRIDVCNLEYENGFISNKTEHPSLAFFFQQNQNVHSILIKK